MKRTLLILTLALGIACTGKMDTVKGQAPTDSVLICKSKSAYAYHRYECKGLKHCTYTIVKVTKAQAVKMGYRPCKLCY
jgi:methylphosphotriester-DNA--protein-cysteine methyltransferase